MSNPTPNREYPGPIGRDGNIQPPQNDEQARARGLEKLTKVSDGSVIYRHSLDRKEIVAQGEYIWVPWP